TEAAIEFSPQFLIVFQSHGRPVEQVVEIEGIGVAHAFLVARINMGDGEAEEIVVPIGITLGAEQLILRLADGAGERLGFEALRRVMTRVLPLPAPARISSGPSICVAASRCVSVRSASRWCIGVVSG